MDFAGLITELRCFPEKFTTIGLGGQCVALVHPSEPDVVLLAQGVKNKLDGNEAGDSGSPASSGTSVLTAGDKSQNLFRSIAISHQNTVATAHGLDAHLEGALFPEFTHSTLLGEAAFDNPLCIKLNPRTEWRFAAARLTKRIPGVSFDQFCRSGLVGLNETQTENVTADIAKWLFLLHHKVSPLLTEQRNMKVFSRAAAQQTASFQSPSKYKFYVVKNVKKLSELRDAVTASNVDEDERISATKQRLEAMGLHADDMYNLAVLLKKRIEGKLQSSRQDFTLTHGDLHPGNILVDGTTMKVAGVCDWMNAVFDHRGMDFIKLSACPGLMPIVFEKYRQKELRARIENPLDAEFVYAFSAMYSLSWLVTSLKGFAGGSEAFCLSAIEQVKALITIEPNIYTETGQKFLQRASPRLPANGYIRPFDSNPTACDLHHH